MAFPPSASVSYCYQALVFVYLSKLFEGFSDKGYLTLGQFDNTMLLPGETRALLFIRFQSQKPIVTSARVMHVYCFR